MALQAAILTFLGFAYMKQIFQFNPMDEVTVSLLCYINFKIRQSFFDIKEFLKNYFISLTSVLKLSLKNYY